MPVSRSFGLADPQCHKGRVEAEFQAAVLLWTNREEYITLCRIMFKHPFFICFFYPFLLSLVRPGFLLFDRSLSRIEERVYRQQAGGALRCSALPRWRQGAMWHARRLGCPSDRSLAGWRC